MRAVHDICTKGDGGISKVMRVDNLREYCLYLIDVNRTVRHSLAQLLPSINVPFERLRMDVVILGLNVVVDGIPQRDSVGPLERNGQLI